MNSSRFFKPYKTIDEFLKIEDENINQPVYYQDESTPLPPLYFAIKNGRADVAKKIIEKQKHAVKSHTPVKLDPVSFTSSLAREALDNQKLSLFINHINTLMLFEKTEGHINQLLDDLDMTLSELPYKKFKLALDELVLSINEVKNPALLTLLNRSKYVEYLNTAFYGNSNAAKKDFNHDQLLRLNKVGFKQAKKNHSDTDARFFIKMALQLGKDSDQQILFSQGLYLDNLDYAIDLINEKENTQLKVDTEGVCSAFTKHWLFNEEQDRKGLYLQNRYFRDVMEIASLTGKEIRERVNTDKAFVERIKNKTRNIDTVQNNNQFEGLTQRSMKKTFGFELINKYKMSKLNLDKQSFAYLRVRYKNGDSHAIGIHIERKKIKENIKTVYKVWDSNHPPKIFSTQSKFIHYLDSIKDNPKVNSTDIYEFSPRSEPATREKIDAIDHFIESTSQLIYPNNSYRRSLLDCIKKLITDYDNGIIPLNEAIPLFALLGSKLNKANNYKEEDNIDLTHLNQVMTKHGLINYKDLDVNTLSFLPDFIEDAISQGAPHIVIALFDLGYSIKESYLDMKKAHQDLILRQAIKENHKTLFDYLVKIRMNDTEDFLATLALEEIAKDSSNKKCQKMLAYLLFKGATLSPDDYKAIEKRPLPNSFFTKTTPLKETIQQTLLQEMLQRIEKNSGRRLGNDDKEFLMMLDAALNNQHAGKKGCYDILTPSTLLSSKGSEPRQQIINALQHHEITLKTSLESKYPFLSAYLKTPQLTS